ncbi:hypothetical protein TeGR_g12805 [Tetraparma gracilis]|uniref:Uncharacterized protein n=1 Tax=Tetraparma gracilis TaxID=2962635 RepID=A0ABQ6MNU4_9STRA|nr:hypothetical protein TeGR_g12805 [Tetraparma gracilis]
MNIISLLSLLLLATSGAADSVRGAIPGDTEGGLKARARKSMAKSGNSAMSGKSGPSAMSGKSGPSAMSGKSGSSAMSGKSGPSAMGMGMGMGMYGVAPKPTCSDEVGDAALRALTKDCGQQLDCANVAVIEGGCDGFRAYEDTPYADGHTINLDIKSPYVELIWCDLSVDIPKPSPVFYSDRDMQEKCSCSCIA